MRKLTVFAAIAFFVVVPWGAANSVDIQKCSELWIVSQRAHGKTIAQIKAMCPDTPICCCVIEKRSKSYGGLVTTDSKSWSWKPSAKCSLDKRDNCGFWSCRTHKESCAADSDKSPCGS